jgi:antitoxin HicB
MTTATHIAEEARRIASLPYAREVIPNSDGTWFAKIAEFAGCMTEGDTQAEAIANLEDAMIGWLETKLEDGDNIPAPATVEDYSGKFLVRVPKSLHRDLARRADHEGVSLNQYVATALARALSSPDEFNSVVVDRASLNVALGRVELDEIGCTAHLRVSAIDWDLDNASEHSGPPPTVGKLILLSHLGLDHKRF